MFTGRQIKPSPDLIQNWKTAFAWVGNPVCDLRQVN